MAEPLPTSPRTQDATFGVCTFLVGDLLCGLRVEDVQEVLLSTRVTRVPRSHPAVSGLLHLRGLIVPVLDLRRLMHLPDRAPSAEPMHVVMATPDGPVSLVVDEVQDVANLATDQLEATPDHLHGESRRFVRGVFQLEGSLLLLLDPSGLVTLPGRS